MASENWTEVRELLAIRLDNLGDVIILEPALRALKAAIPQARLTLLASPNGSRAAALIPWIDDVMVRSVVWQDAQGKMPHDVERERVLIEDIKQRGFDGAAIFTSFSQTPHPAAYVCYMAGIPRRIGQSKEFGGSLLTTWVKAGPDEEHQVDRNLALIRAMDLPLAGDDIRLSIRGEAYETVARKLEARGLAAGQDYIVLNPQASCQARTYAWERFADVAGALVTDLPVVLTGEARYQPVIERIIARAGSDRVVSLCGDTDINELCALVDRAALLITNLTSTTHIASATGTPTVMTYPGTEYISQWDPRGCPNAVLRRDTTCMPCYLFECPIGHDCMDVSPDEVIAESRRLMAPGRAAGRGAK